ncbi:hypothetical protein PRZ48_003910 [Zasmidium cellare]|uniref:RING-type domain-containing protein n=1 Tax=Zasmidium cellare TaxID=395010 RepID=A0ABR0EXG4_ZASCE|nr:hypothetical protein PRZ48_003910 [Zasmidium cellare]
MDRGRESDGQPGGAGHTNGSAAIESLRDVQTTASRRRIRRAGMADLVGMPAGSASASLTQAQRLDRLRNSRPSSSTGQPLPFDTASPTTYPQSPPLTPEGVQDHGNNMTPSSPRFSAYTASAMRNEETGSTSRPNDRIRPAVGPFVGPSATAIDRDVATRIEEATAEQHERQQNAATNNSPEDDPEEMDHRTAMAHTFARMRELTRFVGGASHRARLDPALQQELSNRFAEIIGEVPRRRQPTPPPVTLPTRQGNEGEEECGICLDPAEGTEMSDTPCGHTFHTECMGIWLKDKMNPTYGVTRDQDMLLDRGNGMGKWVYEKRALKEARTL